MSARSALMSRGTEEAMPAPSKQPSIAPATISYKGFLAANLFPETLEKTAVLLNSGSGRALEVGAVIGG